MVVASSSAPYQKHVHTVMASCGGNVAAEILHPIWTNSEEFLPAGLYQECQRMRDLGQVILLFMFLQLPWSE